MDEVKYSLDDKPEFTDRMTPPWWSETRRQELQEYWDAHNLFDKLACPLTMEFRPACEPKDRYFWRLRKVDGGFILEQPGGTGHIGIGTEVFHSDLLEQWAEEGTPLMVEITHGP